ncbi:MAG: protocatechuate 3,4-dioxygenase subunit alpha [Pseudomonadota bacterium]
MIRPKESPSQTAGPYVHIGLTPNVAGIAGVYPADLGQSAAGPDAAGERITVTGQVFDGTGTPLRDALLELWQADAAGRYPGQDGADPHVTGWARCATDMEDGAFRFDTIKPGAVGAHAPHLNLWIVARGINLGLNTRVYFPEDTAAQASDPVLSRIEHRSRIPTLIARPEGAGAYRFDIRLQGEGETIFFDL